MATAHPNHASLVEFGQKHVTKGLGRQVEAVLTKASGSYVSLSDGREMLDFTTGIGVTNLGECLANFVLTVLIDFRVQLGHCHPRVSKAAAEQCMNLVHGQVSHSVTTTRTYMLNELCSAASVSLVLTLSSLSNCCQ